MNKKSIENFADVSRQLAEITNDIEISRYLKGFADAMSLIYAKMDREEAMKEVKKGNKNVIIHKF